MYQAYIPFDFDDSYFESAPTPSSLGTPVASPSQLAVSHRESFERYANLSASTSAAGPSTSHQIIPPQCYTLPTRDEYPPAAEEFHDAEPPGFHEVVPAMPQPNTSQYQLTTIDPATIPFHPDSAYNPHQPVPAPPSTTPAYQLTALDLAPTFFLPDPTPPLSTMQYEPFAVVPAAMAFPRDVAYNPSHSPAVSSAEETPAQTAKNPEITSVGSQSAHSANGLRWKHPMVPAHPPPPHVAHMTTQGKSQPLSSRGRGTRKERSHGVPASEGEYNSETGTPVMISSHPGETVVGDWEFRNTLGKPTKKQKRSPVDQSVPIPGRYCRGCGTNFSRPDGLKRHQKREKCGIEDVSVTAIATGDTGVSVKVGPEGGENGNATTSAMENHTTVLCPAATVKKGAGRRGRGNPRKRKAGEQNGHLGPMANPDSSLLFATGAVSPTEVVAIGKKGQVVQQGSDSTSTDDQAADEFALPVGTAMPYYGQFGGAAYPTSMTSSHPNYGSDRQQYYLSTADQSAHADPYLAYTTQGLDDPKTLTAMAAPQEFGSYDGECRAESCYQGQPSQHILSAEYSGHTQGVYHVQPANAYSRSSRSQNTVSDADYPLTYYGHVPGPYPQQAMLDVHQSQTSFPFQQPDLYPIDEDQLHDFGRGGLVSHSFRPPGQEVLVDASHYQTHIDQYQSSDCLRDSTNTLAARESDPTLGQPAPPSRQQTREGRAVSRLGSDNTLNVGSENTHPVYRRPSVPKLKQSTPLEGQPSTSSVLVSSKSGQSNNHKGLARTVPLSVIALPNVCKIFSSPEKPTPVEEINDADSDDDSLFTDRGSSPS